jgi:hypothetical protein
MLEDYLLCCDAFWRWRQYNPLKCLYAFIRLHGVTYQKAVTLIDTAVVMSIPTVKLYCYKQPQAVGIRIPTSGSAIMLAHHLNLGPRPLNLLTANFMIVFGFHLSSAVGEWRSSTGHSISIHSVSEWILPPCGQPRFCHTQCVRPNANIKIRPKSRKYSYLDWARGGLVIKALRYKPEGRGFDFRWCHWNFWFT